MMKLLQLDISTLMLRFYLVMAIVIGAGFIGQWWLAILALPVFYSALMGLKFGRHVRNRRAKPVKYGEWQHRHAGSNF